ncbi:hypothetical protein [Curtobacterium sp. YR515]|uniref:hypothetical protein n=1 Tax=Curtobacterium sp. YR515 TaxID=1855316 RepID=UPI0008DF1E88|nr:hypothetical protein [Curtobacterium sp. YR515]SFF50248.1 hypothetical protein SAMN05216329_1024 [Curtobacterium sp. YR515]
MHPRSTIARACALGVAGLVLLSGPALSTAAPAQAAAPVARSADSATTPITITSSTTYVKGDPLAISGTGIPDSTIRVWINDDLVADPKLTTDSDGLWTLQLSAAFVESKDSFRLRLYGENGHDSTTTFTADPDAERTPVTITSGTDYVKGQPFTITGTGLPNTTVMAWVNDSYISYPEITVGKGGTWSLRIGAAFAGQDSFSLRLRGTNDHQIETTFTADPDAQPTPIAITSATEYTTSEPLTVSGTGPASTTIQYFIDGAPGPKEIDVDADGRWSLPISAGITARDSFALRLVGENGHDSTTTFTVDPDAKPVPITIESGTSYVKGEPFKVTGTGLPNTTINYGIDGKLISSPELTVDDDGRWTLPIGVAFAGRDSFELRLFGLNGQEAGATFAADPDAEITPVAITSGTSYTRGASLTITGTGVPETRIHYWVNGVPGISPQLHTDADGRWSLQLPPSLTGGETLDLRLVGVNGHDTTTTFTADSDAGTLPVTITSSTEYAKGDPFTITGTGLPNSVIDYWVNDAYVSEPRLVVDEHGQWELPILSEFSRQDSFTLRLRGENGHDSTTTFTADPDAQPTPVMITSGTVYTKGDPFTIAGTGLPETRIQYWVDDALSTAPVTVDENGKWELPISQTFARQDSFTLRLVGVNGHDTTTTFTADPDSEPTPVTITSGTTYTKGDQLTLRGTGLPDTDIRYWLDGKYISDPKLSVGKDGTWSLRISPTFAAQDSFTLRLLGVNDHEVETIFTAAAEAPANEVTVSTTTFVKGQKQLIEGMAAPRAKVEIYSGSKYLMHVIAGADGKWSYTTGGVINTDTFTRTLKSEGAKDVTFTLTAAEQEQAAPITVATTTFAKGQKQLIEGTAAPKARVDVYSGSKYLMHVIADADGKWSYTTGGVINTDTFTRTLKSAGTDDVTFTLTAK